MSALLVLALSLSTPAHAGWWAGFCEKHLIAQDPYPYAEFATRNLLEIYQGAFNRQVREELLFRLRANMLSEPEREIVAQVLKGEP
jgi:hypothetical protein